MTQTAPRASDEELREIHAQFVRSRNGIDMNLDGARAAYQRVVPVLLAEVMALRQEHAVAHATLAQAVPVEPDDLQDLATLSAAVAALWKLQEQGLYAKPALGKLKQRVDDLTVRLSERTAEREDLMNKLEGAERLLADQARTMRQQEARHQEQLATMAQTSAAVLKRKAELEAEVETAYQGQRDLKMQHQQELRARDVAHKQRAQQALAHLVEAHAIVAEDAA